MVVDVHFGPCPDPGSTPGVSTVFLFIDFEWDKIGKGVKKVKNSLKICLTEVKSVRIFKAHNMNYCWISESSSAG